MVEGFLIIQIQFLPCRHYFPALERKGSLFCFVSCVSLVLGLGLGLGILCVLQSRNLVYSCSESNRIRSCLVMEDYYSSNSTMTQNQFANNIAEMITSCTSVELQGVRSLTRIQCENTWKRSMSSSSYSEAMYLSDNEFGEQDRSDDCLHFGEKKRRMTFDQVKTLEKSFELRSNLDPDRKMQLAKALGLQPRQISVWFQNRRARWKTKQLEKDFDALKQEYDTLKRNYDILLQQNRQFKAEVQQRGRELEKKDCNSKVRGSEIEPHQNPDESVPATTDSPMELSLKSEIGTKCTEQLLHDNYPTATKEQEGECSNSMTVAASSNCNINLRRTMEISESSGIPPVAAAAAANRLFPVLAMEGSSGGEQVAANGLHEWHCQPKVEVDQISGEESQCNLFYSLEEQRALMLCEYWHDLPDE